MTKIHQMSSVTSWMCVLWYWSAFRKKLLKKPKGSLPLLYYFIKIIGLWLKKQGLYIFKLNAIERGYNYEIENPVKFCNYFLRK